MRCKKEIATLPLVARALKDDVFILRKFPWGAMTGMDYDTISVEKRKRTYTKMMA